MKPERALGEVFDDVADAYDEAREGYSTDIVASAVERGRLSAGARVVEVGCGTGKLTEVLVALGLRVDAVDPGERMIAAARRRVRASDMVTFHVARFENVSLPHRSFDALFSGTAFHWLDSRVSWKKAAACLRPGGLLALLTHTNVHDHRSIDAEEGFHDLLREYAPSAAATWHPLRDLDTLLNGANARSENVSEVWDWIMGEGRHLLANEEAAQLFDALDVTAVVSDVERTTDELLAHFRTTSLYFQIEPEKRHAFEEADRRLLEAGGGSVHFSSAIVLVTATRRPYPGSPDS
jgi:ubiquinone/menaquinone biosynthesis C-methylase UbiE